jgi:hypothetical protein
MLSERTSLSDGWRWVLRVLRQFKCMWADHGDAISLQYSGSHALKGDLTRTGKRTVGGLLQVRARLAPLSPALSLRHSVSWRTALRLLAVMRVMALVKGVVWMLCGGGLTRHLYISALGWRFVYKALCAEQLRRRASAAGTHCQVCIRPAPLLRPLCTSFTQACVGR